jgi:hypothetical protein
VHASRRRLLSPCAWSPRSVLAVALPGSAARLATPFWAGWPWPSCAAATAAPRAPLPWRRCCGGPAPCRPCLAVASSFGRWPPRPCWHGTLWARRAAGERFVVVLGVTHRPGSTNSAQLPLPELGDLTVLPCFSAITALDKPSSSTMSPPPRANSPWV